ncbi:MAG: exosome complex protein Rrp42 [Methanophagales archaeon]|nr:exosome complex protein Rrp42 [Methanophagales archaeon]MCW3140757.1 exosome complex protein Rrp42 [Methanophagales archaeon]
MGLEIVDDIRKDYVHDLIGSGKRVDGRGFREYREISVERDVIKRAEGSARVKIGNTDVLVGIKLEPGEPFPDAPDEGVIITNAEFVPLASPEFESGPPDENSVQLARVVDRGIRGSEAIDLEKLCIEEGEKVWIVFIDIHILDNDGNLVDAAALGAIASLMNIRIPNERYDLTGENTLPMRDTPVAVTTVEIEGNILVDPNFNEENAATSRLTVISNADGTISAMQKSGSGGLKEEEIVEMVEIGIEKAGEIREKFL